MTDGQLELFLWEPEGINRHRWPVTCGVPLAKGCLRDESQIRLLDDDEELPAVARSTTHWEDGSISWLLLDFQVDLLGNQKKRLQLHYGGDVAVGAWLAPQNEATVNGSRIDVTTGDLQVSFSQGGRMPFDDVRFRGRSIVAPEAALCRIAEQGQSYAAVGDSVRFEVESHNALRTVVVGLGRFEAADGASFMDLTTRVYLYAGHNFVRIYHTITNLEKRDVHLDDLAIDLPLTLDGARGYLVGHGFDDTIHALAGATGSMSVATVPMADTLYEEAPLRRIFFTNKDRAAEVAGTMEPRADDVVYVDTGTGEPATIGAETYLSPVLGAGVLSDGDVTVSLSCRNFYPQAPKRMAIDGARLRLTLYDNPGDEPLWLWRGTAKTHELLLSVHAAAHPDTEDEILACKRRILASHQTLAPTYGESNQLQDSGVFGPLLRYKPREYPWLEYMFRKIYESQGTSTANVKVGSTILNFGDYWVNGRGGQWQNNEMDRAMGLLIYMLRSGYPKPIAEIDAIVHHQMDVDTHHEAQDPIWIGAQRYHQVAHGSFNPPAPCHQWLEGPLYYYLYTGYERAREIALGRAEHYCNEIEAGRTDFRGNERIQGWPIVALSTMHFYFPNERYIRCCHRIFDWLDRWIEDEGDLVSSRGVPVVEGEMGTGSLGRGVIGQALAHYHRMTGEQRAWDMLVFLMDKARDTLFTPEGFTTKLSLMRRNYLSPEADFILEAFGYLWEQTGDEEWLRLAMMNFKLSILMKKPMQGGMAGGLGSETAYRHWTPFLHYADEAGLLEDLQVV